MGSELRRRRASAALGPARRHHNARAALAVIAGVALLVAGLAVFRVWSAIHTISPRAQPADLIALVHAQSDQPGSLGWKIKHDERINVLLLGYGGPGHDGPYLTDSIMLLSIRPGSREAIMISLPRDLWVKIPALPQNGYMIGKLNSAYAIGTDQRDYPNIRSDWKTGIGGGDLAAATVSQVTGQPVNYWVGLDFKAFRSVVNALGGIRVDVPTTLDDPYFPAGESTGMMHVHIGAGWQQFDGERALEYARSRETTSDFDRSRRQQLIMLAVRQRVFSLNAIPRLLSLLGALQDNVRTNLRPAEMQQLAALAGRLKDQDLRRVAIDTSNLLRSGYSHDGQYILQPLDPTYGALHQYVAMALPERSALARQLPFQVEDGSRRYWLPYGIGTPASIMTSLLQAEGWDATLGPAAAPRVAQTQILDGSGGRAAATVAWLQNYFGGVVTTVTAPASGPTVTVVLGPDFTARAFP
ncbi:MAG TPA: LCP family protein [Candidatus Dormibacteraeota bacterium]|nr:LCP family protein [Candidatus Dormibacteraeota bacterium]